MGISDLEARAETAQEEYDREVGQRTLAEIKENAINAYFFYYGDDIEQRIQSRIDAAKELAKLGFDGESLTSSIVAAELTIRWFLLRPLCEAAFMSEEVADVLVQRILPPRTTGTDREILPQILREWGADVRSLRLSDGSELWKKLTTEYIQVRNQFIHLGQAVEKAVAAGAVDAAERLLAEAIRLVTPFKARGKQGWAPKSSRRRLDAMEARLRHPYSAAQDRTTLTRLKV